MGTSGVGAIVEVGADVSDWKVGDRVISFLDVSETDIINTRRQLPWQGPPLWLDGCIWHLGDIDPLTALCFEPAFVAFHCIRESQVRFADTVAVIGLGAIGLLAVRMAALSGEEQIFAVDPLPKRRELALDYGAHHALDLLDVPAAAAARGFHSCDLSVYHLPTIERSYLAELRSAFEQSRVELFQLLIDSGKVATTDPDGRSAGIKHIKRWMEIAVELGATGVRYVPGDSEPTPETIRASGEAFRELYDYCRQCGVEPATENYKFFNNEADDLLGVLDRSEREYGLVTDFGNAEGPNKYATLENWRHGRPPFTNGSRSPKTVR